MQNKLLPCPFCGGKAHIYKCESKFLGKTFYAVDCDSNECIVHTMVADYLTEKEAIKAWNTRKPMERIVERLEKEIDPYYFLEPSWETREVRINKHKGFCEGIDKAIGIVKAGGIDAE